MISFHFSVFVIFIHSVNSIHHHRHHNHRHRHHYEGAWRSMYARDKDHVGDIAALWPNKANSSTMRNALRPNARNRWTEYTDSEGNYVVPYRIVGRFSRHSRHKIHGAMAEIGRNSCIRFRKRHRQRDFLRIKNDRGQGCYSADVGRLPGGANIVNLETNLAQFCATERGPILHELFHILGLWHEHQRWDRDQYVAVHDENALPGTNFQMVKTPPDRATQYGVRYDYRSVMHYPKDGFALFPGLVVLETKNPEFQDVIGHAKDASPKDYLKICAIYGCRTCMGKPFKRADIAKGRAKRRKVVHRHKRKKKGGHHRHKCDSYDCGAGGCWCRHANGHWEFRPFQYKKK